MARSPDASRQARRPGLLEPAHLTRTRARLEVMPEPARVDALLLPGGDGQSGSPETFALRSQAVSHTSAASAGGVRGWRLDMAEGSAAGTAPGRGDGWDSALDRAEHEPFQIRSAPAGQRCGCQGRRGSAKWPGVRVVIGLEAEPWQPSPRLHRPSAVVSRHHLNAAAKLIGAYSGLPDRANPRWWAQASGAVATWQRFDGAASAGSALSRRRTGWVWLPRQAHDRSLTDVEALQAELCA